MTASPGMLGRNVEGYRVTRLLGRGAAGSRYEVEHADLGKAVLRVFDNREGYAPPSSRPSISGFGAGSGSGVAQGGSLLGLARAKRLCAVSHRNLARIHRAGRLEPEGAPFLVEEQIVGTTLKERLLRTGPLSGEEALLYLAQAAAGLSALHQAGISHGNLSLNTITIAGPAYGQAGHAVPAAAPGGQAVPATAQGSGQAAPATAQGSGLAGPAGVQAATTPSGPLPGLLGELGDLKLTGLVLNSGTSSPSFPSTALSEEIASDLRQLGGVFAALCGVPATVLSGAERPDPRLAPALIEAMLQVNTDGPSRARTALELYERAEAALRKGGLLDAEDSTALWVGGETPLAGTPLGAPKAAAPPGSAAGGDNDADNDDDDGPATLVDGKLSVAALRPGDTGRTERRPRTPQADPGDDAHGTDLALEGDDDEAVTVEIEQMDAAEMLSFLSARSMDNLVGPLDNVTRRMEAQPEPDQADPSAKAVRNPKVSTQQMTGAASRLAATLSGPGRWLLPLGLCTALTLALAAWTLWGGGAHKRLHSSADGGTIAGPAASQASTSASGQASGPQDQGGAPQ